VNWTEQSIARAIALQTLDRKCVVLVDNCSWTGHECDVLGVTRDLRIIDVEVKISRADLKADARKDKWWKYLTYAEAQEAGATCLPGTLMSIAFRCSTRAGCGSTTTPCRPKSGSRNS